VDKHIHIHVTDSGIVKKSSRKKTKDVDGSKLSAQEMNSILKQSGYGDAMVKTARCVKRTVIKAEYVYDITYDDPEEGVGRGKVYVTEENGRLKAEF